MRRDCRGHRPGRRAADGSKCRSLHGARCRDVHGCCDADRHLRRRNRRSAGALRRAWVGGAAHGRRRQGLRDALRTSFADRLERPVPLPGRRWQRRHRGTGSRAQYGIVSGHRTAARLRRRDHGRGTPGRDARSSVSILSLASIMPTPRTNEPRRSHLRSCRAITAAPPIEVLSSAVRAVGGRA